jgi:nickel-dependent lactate racemase
MITSPGYSRPDQWQVQIQAMIQLKADVMVRADRLSDDQIRAAHLQPIHDVSSAVESAMRTAGKNATVCILPNGPQTIPYCKV